MDYKSLGININPNKCWGVCWNDSDGKQCSYNKKNGNYCNGHNQCRPCGDIYNVVERPLMGKTVKREKCWKVNKVEVKPNGGNGCFQNVNEYGKDRLTFNGEIDRSDDDLFDASHHKIKDGEDVTVGVGLKENTLYINPNTIYNRRDYYYKYGVETVYKIKYQIPKDNDSIIRANNCIGKNILIYIRLFNNIYEFKQRFYCERKKDNYLILYARC